MSDALERQSIPMPSIEHATLPETYERAKVALAACLKIDECKDWADKMAALASYAKQAEDQSLHHFALRISSRAIRRCGELLEDFEQSRGGDRKSAEYQEAAAGPLMSQRRAGTDAGMSERQIKTAVRVANVPVEDFEALVESADPPTVTQLAALGTTPRPPRPPLQGEMRPVPEKFSEATHILGVLHELVLFCAEHPPALVGEAVMPHEVKGFRANVVAMEAWWAECLLHVPEGTC